MTDMYQDYATEQDQKFQAQLESEFAEFADPAPIDAQPVDGQLEGEFAKADFVPKAEITELPEEEKTIGEKIAAPFVDVAKGVTELPRSVVRGFEKASAEMWELTPFFEEGEVMANLKFEGLVPDVGESTTAKIAEGLAQFGTGMAVGGPLTKVGKLGKLTGKAKVAMDVVVRPAVAELLAFDEREERLSNVLSDIDAVSKAPVVGPVMNFLKAEKDDSVLEGKAKQALEGILTNAGVDAVMGGVKVMRKMRGIKNKVKDIPPMNEGAEQAFKERMSPLGDIADEDLVVKSKIRQAIEETKGIDPKNIPTGKEPDFFFNWNKIRTGDDVKRAQRDYMRLNQDNIMAQVGKQSEEEVLKKATEGSFGFEDLMRGREGAPLRPEEVVVARRMYDDASEKLLEVSKLLANNPEDLELSYSFRKMLATHHAIQKEVKQATADAGRALQAWNIDYSQGSKEARKQMETIVNEFGGSETASNLAQKIAAHAGGLTSEQLNTITNKGWSARTFDAMQDVWIGGLLSAPTTHMRNFGSGIMTAFTSAAERGVAAGIDDSVSGAEALQYAYGLVSSLSEAWRAGKQGFMTGSASLIAKDERTFVSATSKEMFDPSNRLGLLSDGVAMYGSALRALSTKPLAAGDAFNKTLFFNAEKRAILTRRGVERGMKGQDLSDFVNASMKDADDLIDREATQYALTQTFNNNLSGFGEDFQRVISRNKALRYVVPFVRTPINVFEYSFKRTPLAPAFKSYREDIAAGGVRAAKARAGVAMGSALMMSFADMTNSGVITGGGPTEANKRQALSRMGWKPYAVKIGDKYVSYLGMEPMSSLMSMAADFSEVAHAYSMYDIEAETELGELASGIVMSVVNNLGNKSYLTGFIDLSNVIADPARYADFFVQRYAGSAIPNISRSATTALDPQRAYVDDIMSTMKDRMFMRGDLPKKRNVWGEVIRYRPQAKTKAGEAFAAAGSMFNPFFYSSIEESPIDKEIFKVDANIMTPRRKQYFGGQPIEMTPQQYERYLILSGNELKLPMLGDKGCKDFLNDLVSGKDPRSPMYDRLPTDAKAKQLRDFVDIYRDAAKRQMIEEDVSLRTKVNIAKQREVNEMLKGMQQ